MNLQLAFDQKGTLGRVWLAAHWEKKLSKSHIFTHNIKDSVDVIKQPGGVLSLRISGHLLLGVIKLYDKKI